MAADPNGCRWCSVPEREHGRRWNSEAGVHNWAEPFNEQRLQRMRDRRAARTAAPTPEPPDLDNLTGIWLPDELLQVDGGEL